MNHTTIIIPTYNESGNIEALTRRIFEVVPEVRILVVDDNSPDGTADIVRRIMENDIRVSILSRAGKEGLGKAYLHAFNELLQEPSNEFLVMMDADFSHDPVYLLSMIEAAESADVVVGSRYCRGGATEGWKPWRKYLSSFANLYCSLISRMPIYDATAGYNLIRVDTLRRVGIARLDSSGYAFQMELKYLLWRSGASFTEVPIVFKERREGESKISNHIILEGIIAPWKMKFKKHR